MARVFLLLDSDRGPLHQAVHATHGRAPTEAPLKPPAIPEKGLADHVHSGSVPARHPRVARGGPSTLAEGARD